MNRAFPLSLFLLAMPTTATALDLSKPGYAVFYENVSILGTATRADCEASRERYLDRRAPELIQSGDIALGPWMVPEVRKMLESHLSACTQVRVNPTSDTEPANYFIAGGRAGWIGATTEAACREIAKADGLECHPVRIARQ